MPMEKANSNSYDSLTVGSKSANGGLSVSNSVSREPVNLKPGQSSRSNPQTLSERISYRSLCPYQVSNLEKDLQYFPRCELIRERYYMMAKPSTEVGSTTTWPSFAPDPKESARNEEPVHNRTVSVNPQAILSLKKCLQQIPKSRHGKGDGPSLSKTTTVQSQALENAEIFRPKSEEKTDVKVTEEHQKLPPKSKRTKRRKGKRPVSETQKRSEINARAFRSAEIDDFLEEIWLTKSAHCSASFVCSNTDVEYSLTGAEIRARLVQVVGFREAEAAIGSAVLSPAGLAKLKAKIKRNQEPVPVSRNLTRTSLADSEGKEPAAESRTLSNSPAVVSFDGKEQKSVSCPLGDGSSQQNCHKRRKILTKDDDDGSGKDEAVTHRDPTVLVLAACEEDEESGTATEVAGETSFLVPNPPAAELSSDLNSNDILDNETASELSCLAKSCGLDDVQEMPVLNVIIKAVQTIHELEEKQKGQNSEAVRLVQHQKKLYKQLIFKFRQKYRREKESELAKDLST